MRYNDTIYQVVCETCGVVFGVTHGSWMHQSPSRYCSRVCYRNRFGTVEERFWSHVDTSNTDGCWPWTAGRRRANWYGNFSINGRTFSAHRVAYEITYGPIPDDLYCCHSCDEPLCCRPDHLWLGTNRQNTQDRHAKGRDASGDRGGLRLHPERRAFGERNAGRKYPGIFAGENNGRAKLTWDIATTIRGRYQAGGISQQRLADEYGVSQVTISKIAQGKFWPESKRPV